MIDTRRALLLYVDDWLASPTIEAMTPAEEGAYLRLLLRAWQSPDCGLPADDASLARLSRLGDAWLASAEKLRACFFARRGRLYNARLLRERKNQNQYRENIRRVRQAAAKKRWYAFGMHLHSNQTQTQAQSSSEVHGSSQTCPSALADGRAERDRFADWWALYPRHVARAAAERAYRRQIGADAAKHDELMAATREYLRVAWQPMLARGEGQYIPHGATYLSQRRWTEAPEAPAARRNGAVRPLRIDELPSLAAELARAESI